MVGAAVVVAGAAGNVVDNMVEVVVAVVHNDDFVVEEFVLVAFLRKILAEYRMRVRHCTIKR